MTDSTPQAEPDKGGAPSGNRSALRWGLYSPRLPDEPGSTYAEKSVNEFRRAIEDAAIAIHGQIDPYHAALIHSATEATRVALANRLYFQQHAANIDAATRLQFERSYLSALDVRDRKLKSMGLDTINGHDPAAIYQNVIEAPHVAPDASERNGTNVHPADDSMRQNANAEPAL